MILTITPNPSVDYLFEAERLCWDDANRVEMPRRRAGGQGINLTRAARVLGGESVALALLGGDAGRTIESILEAEGTRCMVVPIEADTRVFFAVRETASGRSMLVNARGPVLGKTERSKLLQQAEAACRELKPEWVVCCGSVPRGIGDDLYARIGDIAHAHNARFIADCDGEPLVQAARRGCDLLVPNKHEAQRLTNHSICSLADALTVVRALQKLSREVYLKLGSLGAIAASNGEVWLAEGPELQTGNAVGAGDAFLAALLVAKEKGAPPQEALHDAVAAGTAVLLSRGSDLLTPADYRQMHTQIKLRRLSE